LYIPARRIKAKEALAGTISLMPGTSANPAFRRIDVDPATGKVSGLF
jgi:formyltetrahydrofolate synthetase